MEEEKVGEEGPQMSFHLNIVKVDEHILQLIDSLPSPFGMPSGYHQYD
jgi:hypothetical protein